jgi:hypothetical protein
LPASATNSIYIGSYVNSCCTFLLVLFVNALTTNYATVNLSKIGSGILARQDPETINERLRLYTHISLIPVLNGVRLGTSP